MAQNQIFVQPGDERGGRFLKLGDIGPGLSPAPFMGVAEPKQVRSVLDHPCPVGIRCRAHQGELFRDSFIDGIFEQVHAAEIGPVQRYAARKVRLGVNPVRA